MQEPIAPTQAIDWPFQHRANRRLIGPFRVGLPTPEKAALFTLAMLALFLDVYHIDRNGYANTYYATAVKSMLLNWHNFFFVAFDPGGFVSVDKPPLGLWIETLSAKLLGFNGVSLILPSALAGVGSVLLLWGLVRRAFGGAIALLAAFLLAISPINVVSNRDNILDSMLVFTLLAATCAVVRATERGSFPWLVASGALVGLAFNIKMLQAYLLVPAFVVLFLLCARLSWVRRVAYLCAMLATMLFVSLSWVTVVDLTPAGQRPYVGSSTTNSALELALGYNGIQRLLGHPVVASLPAVIPHAILAHAIQTSVSPIGAFTLQLMRSGSALLPTVTKLDLSSPSLFRLVNPPLGSQVSWALPLALFGLFSSLWGLRLGRVAPRNRAGNQPTRQQQAMMLWGIWAVTVGAIFSAAQFFNTYYLSELAPAVCALAAIGAVGLWRDYRSGEGIRSWLFPMALLATGVEQWYLLSTAPNWLSWLPTTLLSVTFGLSLVLVLRRDPLRRWLVSRQSTSGGVGAEHTILQTLVTLSIVAVLTTPTLWTLASLRNANAGGGPLSGPMRHGVETALTPRADPLLVDYLLAHANGTRYLVATVYTGDAVPIIFSTDAPVMAMGGYKGFDPILTVSTLQDAVKTGIVHLFWLPSENISWAQVHIYYPLVKEPPPTVYTNKLTRWVSQTCAVVPPMEWTLQSPLRHMPSKVLFNCPFVRKS